MKLLFYIFFTLICLSNINLNFNHDLHSDEYDSLIYPEQKHRDQALLISRLLSKYHYKRWLLMILYLLIFWINMLKV